MSEKTLQYIAKTTPDLLLATFGHAAALTAHESYPFTKADKQEAFRAIQTPSPASLMPVPEVMLELNHHDGGNRRFIMIQLPEPTPADSIAGKAGYETVSEVGKERIRRVIAKLQNDEQHGQLSLDLQSDEDLGFRLLKLAPSTFRQWAPPEGDDTDALEHQLSYFDHGLGEDADPNHVIYEVILKEGFSLNARIEPLDIATNQVYRVSQPEIPKKLASSTSAWTTASKIQRSTLSLWTRKRCSSALTPY